MRALRLILLWLAIVVIFALYGWFRYNFELAVAFGAIGIGAASCIVAGLIVIGEVRSRRLARGEAVLLLLASSVLGTILPAVVLHAVEFATRPPVEPLEAALTGVHLFQGERGVWLVLAPFCTVWIALLVFVTFVVCVFSVKR